MAVRFTAAGQHYSVAAGISPQLAYTMAGWFRYDGGNGGTSNVFGGFIDTLTSSMNFGTLVGGNNLFWGDGTGFGGTPAFVADTWYYVAVSIAGNGSNFTGAGFLYARADGDASAVISAQTNGNGTTEIGTIRIGADNFGDWLGGYAANVRVWSAALTQTELDAEASYYRPARTANLVGWWPLANDTDTADQSGNGLTLSGSGGTAASGPAAAEPPIQDLILPVMWPGPGPYPVNRFEPDPRATPTVAAFPTDWAYRRAITIDHTKVSSTLTDFPALVRLTSTDTGFFGNAKPDGLDIRFTSDAAGTTLLDFERERHDSANSLAEYHVRIPSVSSTVDTAFYLWYGVNPLQLATDGAAPVGAVWDANFLGVWHLASDPTGIAPQFLESNNTVNSGTAAGTFTSGNLVAGKIGQAINFGATNQSIQIPATMTLQNLTQYTIEAWVKLNNLLAVKIDIFEQPPGATSATRAKLALNTDETFIFQGRSAGVDALSTYVNPAGAISAATWYHVVAVFDSVSDVHSMWINGVKTTNSVVAATVENVAPLSTSRIGSRADGTAEFFDGVIDDVRVHNTARADGWYSTTYHSGLGDLLAVGAESAAGTITWSADAALAVTATLTADAAGTFGVAAALPVTATLTAAAAGTHPVAAALAATATLTAAATRTAIVDAALPVTATLTAAPLRTALPTASLAVTATSTAAAALTAVVAGSLAATATLTATATATHPVDAALPVTATLTAAGTRTATVDAALPVTATLAADSLRTALPTAALAVTSTLTATGVGTHPVDAALPVTATLTAAGTRTALVDAALPVTATLAAAGTVSGAAVNAPLAVTATLTAAALRTALPDAALPVTATLAAAGLRTAMVDAALPVTATLTAAALRAALVDAALPATVTLAAGVALTAVAAGPLAVTATITVTAAGTHPVDSALSVTATLAAAATRTALPTAALAVTATTAAAVALTAVTSATLAVTATITGSTATVATAALAVTATLTSAGVGTRPADAALVVTATLASAAAGTHPVDAALPVTATLTAAPLRTTFPTAALALTATLTAAALRTALVDAALAVTVTVTAASSRTALVDAALPVTVTVTATATTVSVQFAAGSLAVTVVLAAGVVRLQTVAGALAVVATLFADADLLTGIIQFAVFDSDGSAAGQHGSLTAASTRDQDTAIAGHAEGRTQSTGMVG